MSLIGYALLTALLVGLSQIYFRIARHFSLFDAPNERSSHANLITIRAGGILFYLAVLIAVVANRLNLPYFFAGLTIVSLISFWDDFGSLPIRYRIMAQFIAVGLLLFQTDVFPDKTWVVFPLLIVGVGGLNAYNFMDGINGMTAFYCLVTVGTCWSLESQISNEITNTLLPFVGIALLVFSYFNARRQAICFAGDVGSISIGFINLYVLLTIINQMHTYLPILFLAVYGVDSVLTIGHRLFLGQSIFQAHRLHLFQLLVHQGGWAHLWVSALYALTQLGINGLVLLALSWSLKAQMLIAGLILGILCGLYICLKRWLMSYAYTSKKGRFS